MFFVSDDLSNTFLWTIQDHMYGKKCPFVFVNIHPATFKVLEKHSFTYKERLVQPLVYDNNEYIWDMGSFKVQFFLSPQMKEDTVYVFDDTQISTITYNQENGEEKNTLPGS